MARTYQWGMTDQLAAVTKAERKLLLVPLVFIFLQIWDIIGVFLFVYLKKDGRNPHYYWLQLFTVSTKRLYHLIVKGINFVDH